MQDIPTDCIVKGLENMEIRTMNIKMTSNVFIVLIINYDKYYHY